MTRPLILACAGVAVIAFIAALSTPVRVPSGR
jgi:hypothetical protein